MSIQQKKSKSGKIYYVVIMSDGIGRVTSWTRLIAGKVYEFDITEKDGYKNAKNIFETFDEKIDAWIKEKDHYKSEIKKQADEIELLTKHITFLEKLVTKQ